MSTITDPDAPFRYHYTCEMEAMVSRPGERVAPIDWKNVLHTMQVLKSQCATDESILLFYDSRHFTDELNTPLIKKKSQAWGESTEDTKDAIDPALLQVLDCGLAKEADDEIIVFNKWLSEEINDRHMPVPDMLFSSDMERALTSAEQGPLSVLTGLWKAKDSGSTFKSDTFKHRCAVLQELRTRQSIGRLVKARLPLSETKLRHPEWTYPEDMPEDDPLFYPTDRSSKASVLHHFRANGSQLQWEAYVQKLLDRPVRPPETHVLMCDRSRRGLDRQVDKMLADGAEIAMTVAHGFVVRARGIAAGAPKSSMDTYVKSVAADMRMMMLRVTPIVEDQDSTGIKTNGVATL